MGRHLELNNCIIIIINVIFYNLITLGSKDPERDQTPRYYYYYYYYHHRRHYGSCLLILSKKIIII